MTQMLFMPPVAFLVYIGLATTLYGFGRLLAPAQKQTSTKSSIYAGGESAETYKAAPGYHRFYIVALFFVILHLGALVTATVGLAGGPITIGIEVLVALLIYLGGLVLALLILLVN